MFSANVQVESYLISYILTYSKEQSIELRTWLKTYVHLHMYIILFLSHSVSSQFSVQMLPLLSTQLLHHCWKPQFSCIAQLHTYIHTYAYSITKQQTERQKITTNDSQATAKRKLQTKKSLKYQISVWRWDLVKFPNDFHASCIPQTANAGKQLRMTG